MLSGSTQSNFNPNYSQQQPYPSNFQPILMAPNGMAPSFQMQNNFGNPFQPMESQRFSNQQNYNKMSYPPHPPQQQIFQTPPNPQIHSNINVNQMKASNNICEQKPQNMGKRANIPFESSVRPNKPIFNANDQQRSEAIKAAQMRTKRAKQLLTKKHQNVVKEVQIVRNPNPVPIVTTSQKKDKEIEAAVGVDDEYKQKLEEQKRLREEVLRKKEERRKAMAAQRQRETESKSDPQSYSTQQKSSPVRSQGQQQIATLLNRSPQPTSNVMSKAVTKRIVKTMTNEKPNTSKPVINRVVISNSQTPKRSVLIKGLAASTTELAVRKLCKPIGAIESCKISVSCGQKTATVTFVRSEDAIQFQSKYSRTLLDLSIIQVSLIWFVSYNFNIFFIQSVIKSIDSQLQRNAFISKLQNLSKMSVYLQFTLES